MCTRRLVADVSPTTTSEATVTDVGSAPAIPILFGNSTCPSAAVTVIGMSVSDPPAAKRTNSQSSSAGALRIAHRVTGVAWLSCQPMLVPSVISGDRAPDLGSSASVSSQSWVPPVASERRNVNAVVSTVIGASVESCHSVSPPAVPSATDTNVPGSTCADVAKSVPREAAPDATTL